MNDRFPAATVISNGFDRLIAWMTGLDRRTAWVIAASASFVLCVAQVVLGARFSLAALSLLPISFTAWTLGARAGLIVAVTISTVGVIVQGPAPTFAPHLEAHGFAAAWNIGMRVFASGFNVMLVSGFRRTFDIERWRARHDGLTGAVNKQVFLAHLDKVLPARKGAMALAYLDLDGFKQVNDRYGHLAGDEVLVRFAEGAAALLRPEDCFARFGGDEFVVLAGAGSSEAAMRAIESIHYRLTRLLRGLPYGVTCSTGAIILAADQTVERAEFVRLADELMYEVKRSGRNALRLARLDDSPEEAGRKAA